MQYYVHWYYGEQNNGKGKDIKNLKNGKKNSRYNEKIAEKLIKRTNQDNLAKFYRKIIKQAHGFKSDNDVIKFLNKEKILFQESEFQKAVDLAFKIVNQAAPIDDTKVREHIRNGIKINAKGKVEEFQGELKPALEALADFLSNVEEICNKGNTQVYYSFLKQYYGKIDEKLDKILDNKNEAIKIMTKTKKKSVETDFDILKEREKRLKSYIDELNAKTQSIDDKGNIISKEDNMVKYVNSLFNFQAQRAGELYEMLIADIANMLIENNLLPSIPGLKAEFVGQKGFSGEGRNQNFSKYTTDLKLNFDVAIPTSISIKRSKASYLSKDLEGLHLKGKDMSFRTMLNVLNSRSAGLFDKQQEGALYNILANHRNAAGKQGRGGGGGAKYVYGNINQYYNALNKAMLIPAIAGSLRKEDLATLFLVNEKVYSIIDILAHANSAQIYGGFSGVNNKKQQSIRAQHRWVKSKEKGKGPYDNDKIAAKERSDNIIKIIGEQKFGLKLKLKISQLKNFYSI